MDKTQVKLFPNFTSITCDYLLISWVKNYTRNLGFFTYLSHRKLRTEKLIFLTFLTKHFLMCSFVWLGFINRLLIPWHLHKILNFDAILTLKNTECCHGSFVISQINIICHPQYYNDYKLKKMIFNEWKRGTLQVPVTGDSNRRLVKLYLPWVFDLRGLDAAGLGERGGAGAEEKTSEHNALL